MNAGNYDNAMHTRCIQWANWLTDPKRSLKHRAALVRLIKQVWPEYADHIGLLVQVKSLIQIQRSKNKKS